jgi:hypothetical protein
MHDGVVWDECVHQLLRQQVPPTRDVQLATMRQLQGWGSGAARDGGQHQQMHTSGRASLAVDCTLWAWSDTLRLVRPVHHTTPLPRSLPISNNMSHQRAPLAGRG